MRNAERFPAVRTKIDVALAQKALQPAAKDFFQFLAAMRADGVEIVLFFNRQHRSILRCSGHSFKHFLELDQGPGGLQIRGLLNFDGDSLE